MHLSGMASSDDLTNCLMLEDTRYKIKADSGYRFTDISYWLLPGVSTASSYKDCLYLEGRPLTKDCPSPFDII